MEITISINDEYIFTKPHKEELKKLITSKIKEAILNFDWGKMVHETIEVEGKDLVVALFEDISLDEILENVEIKRVLTKIIIEALKMVEVK